MHLALSILPILRFSQNNFISPIDVSCTEFDDNREKFLRKEHFLKYLKKEISNKFNCGRYLKIILLDHQNYYTRSSSYLLEC